MNYPSLCKTSLKSRRKRHFRTICRMTRSQTEAKESTFSIWRYWACDPFIVQPLLPVPRECSRFYHGVREGKSDREVTRYSGHKIWWFHLEKRNTIPSVCWLACDRLLSGNSEANQWYVMGCCYLIASKFFCNLRRSLHRFTDCVCYLS